MRHVLHEGLDLLLRAEPHHALDTSTIVPAPVEQDHFLGCGQMTDIALKIPVCDLTVGRLAKGHDAHLARAEVLDDALDGAIFSGGIAAFENHQNPVVALDHVALQLHKLDLKRIERRFVLLVREFCFVRPVLLLLRHAGLPVFAVFR